MEMKDLKIGQTVYFEDSIVDSEGTIIFMNSSSLLLVLPEGSTANTWTMSAAHIASHLHLAGACRPFIGRKVRWIDCWNVQKIIHEAAVAGHSSSAHVHGLNCVQCNYGDKFTTQANMTDNRFLCFSCKSSYFWKYREEFLK